MNALASCLEGNDMMSRLVAMIEAKAPMMMRAGGGQIAQSAPAWSEERKRRASIAVKARLARKGGK